LALFSDLLVVTQDTVVMRVMDTLLAFPIILIGIIIIVILGTSAVNIAIAVAIANIPLVTRLVRAEVLRERERDYIQAAIALGANHGRILFHHLLPNTTGVIIVQVATSLGAAILLEAALSFLGLGAQPPTPSWGAMLRDAKSYLRQAPWYAIAPGVALTLLIVGVNYFANALRVLSRRR
jgi:ABC-type dipeptide/oligopeptide/nickel transport system permease subunit